jgi:arylsulfatase A-like enzyme
MSPYFSHPALRASGAVLILLAAVLCACRGESPEGDPGAPLLREDLNVVLVVLDTVRADRVPCRAGSGVPTPRLDALARTGICFERFFSTSSWTLPAHASLFTGLYPVGHRATQETLVLDDRYPTLAEIYGRAGYQTFGTSGNPLVAIDNGLARGFHEFVETFRPSVRRRYASGRLHPNSAALEEFLGRSDRSRPFFAFVNFIEAHTPYAPPQPFLSESVGAGFAPDAVAAAMQSRMPDHYLSEGGLGPERFALLNRLYDGEISYLDVLVGQLVDLLDRDGRLGKTVLVITSDHGENLGEKGHFAHVFGVQNTLLRIPLIIILPDGSRAGEVRDEAGQILDLFPTLLALCGIPIEERHDGRDLLSVANGDRESYVFSEYYFPRQALSVFSWEEIAVHGSRLAPYMHRLRTFQDDAWKFIWSSGGRHELYDMSRDPEESVNLLEAHPSHELLPAFLSRLSMFVERYEGEIPLPPPPTGWDRPELDSVADDQERLEELRSLGYIR